MPTTNINLYKRWLSHGLRGGGLFLAFLVVFNGSCPPPAVVDEPASNLTATVTVVDVDETPSDGKVPIVIQFFKAGKYVQLASGATVTCNGVNLPLGGLGYAERVPIVAPGGSYNCLHSRAAVNSPINITVPARPVITAPAAGSTVTRSNNLTINYAADGGSGIRGGGGTSSTSQGHDLQNDTGTYTGLDVSGLGAGPGTVYITREFTSNIPGTGFISVELKYSSSKSINVTWN